MPKDLLRQLLERLNQDYPTPTLKENLSGIDGMSFDDLLIRNAEKDGFIRVNESTYQLTHKGIEMLNSVVMIKSVNRLRGLLEKLDDSTQKLDDSIKDFNKSSNRLSRIIIGLTVGIALLTVATTVKIIFF